MVLSTPEDRDRSSKRGRLAYIFSSSVGPNEHHGLDNESGDYKEMQDSILSERRTSVNSRKTEIQMLNLRNSRLLQLPTEVLLQVFKYLDKSDLFSLLTVCREFADLIIEMLWFRPNMQSDSAFQKIKQVMLLPSSKTHWEYRNYVKRLNLSFMTKLVDDSLLHLFASCPKLERLTLVNCSKLTHIPISHVLQNCDRLQSIDMTGVQDIQDDIFYALAENCPRLQGLYAPGCGSISEDAIIKLLSSCPMLKRIKFNNSDNITDSIIKAMYENCKSLVEIDLHKCPNVTDVYLKKIFFELTQLREFRVSNAAGITDHLFDDIPDDHFLDKLRIIDVTECNAITDKLVEKMVKVAPRLRNVVLSKCLQITDASLRHLTKLGRSLHYIHLGHCALITDYGVQSLVRSCHRIQYIDLACCSQLTDWTLLELASLPRLRRIGLVKCNAITDTGIAELVRRRGEQDCLERVHLSYCTNLTIPPIYYLLKTCPRLTHLSLTGISAFLSRDITQFCRDPPPDFTENQKSSFCVFSGHGVVQLRNHLDSLMQQRAASVDNYGLHNVIVLPFSERRRLPQVERREDSPNTGEFDTAVNGTNARGAPNDEDMNLWATQRGLGGLRRLRVDNNGQSEVNTDNGSVTSLGDVIEQPAVVNERNQLRVEFQRFAPIFGPNLFPQTLPVRPGNAPQIVQPPFFIANDVGVDESTEDVDMEVDLFPPISRISNEDS